MRTRAKSSGLVLLLAFLTAACWWGWMAWDDTYQIDPVTGYASGPYEGWQVVGCVLCLLLLGSLAALLMRAWVVIVTMTVAFTIAWTMTAIRQDDTGLFIVGAALVFVGMAAATGVLVPVVQATSRRWRVREAV